MNPGRQGNTTDSPPPVAAQAKAKANAMSPTKSARPQSAAATVLSASGASTRSSSRPAAVTSLAILYSQPTSVHFGGFQLDQTYTQRIFVHNNSKKPVRMQYTFPTKTTFRVSFPHDRPTFVPAGLHEELIVTFKPKAFQYYYDCIHVRCEEIAYSSNASQQAGGSCIVPLHAYPVVNEVKFPSRMDFGVVAVGATARMCVDLSCSVPIEFEYELQLIKPHPSFSIFPLQGTIPANGTARLEFEFRPLAYTTARCDVSLMVSQLGFTPMLCVVSGSSSPDVTRLEAEVAARKDDLDDLVASAKSPSRTRPPSSPTKSPKARPQTAGSPSKRKHNDAAASPEEEEPEKVAGVEIPKDLSTVTSVNFMLTQQAGKLKPKDLKKAIDANRAMRKQQKKEQAKLAISQHEGQNDQEEGESAMQQGVLTFRVLVQEESSFLERAQVSRQVKEMFFLQELSEIDQMEKELEFQSHKIHLGQKLLTDKQLAFLPQIREMNEMERQRREREVMRAQIESKAFNMYTPQTKELRDPPRASLPAGYTPDYVPDFKSYKNDMWNRRKRIVQKMMRAISTCIIRLRAQKRLDKIKQWLGNARTRSQVRDKVAQDWENARNRSAATNKRVTSAGGTRKVVEDKPTTTIAAQSIYLEGFPIVEEKDAKFWQPMVLPPDWDLKFDSFAFFPVKERNEALVHGHEAIEVPPLPSYVPLERSRPFRSGAFDEHNVGPPPEPPKTTVDGQDFLPPKTSTRTASLLQQLAPDVFLRPNACFRPMLRINAPRETESWFVLRPQRVYRTPPRNYGAIIEESVGGRSLFVLKQGVLMLHQVHLPRSDRPRTQPLLPNEGSETMFRDVWSITEYAGMPSKLLSSVDDVPALSDSESDDETGSSKQLPTFEAAKVLFESAEDAEPLSEQELESGELWGTANGVSRFERYRHLIRLERAYNTYREDLFQLLLTQLKDVAKDIHHIDYELVIEGHGPERPLHHAVRTVPVDASGHPS
ncbi:TPA: hypothetical protein N0F65_009166 [Lagenidium giganteum]|uniref:Primary ciliary dyskinesia protein 1 n=1 Tax=Lagenidium giganteum TaxID=4803 RepID=A0AAV2YTK9_9STRA|nr:TPA: hypothetical protein N0F65_009166 [Lagenidium giganteum]